MNDYIKLENIIYKNNNFYLTENLKNIDNYLDNYIITKEKINYDEIIDNPLFICNTLHSCYSHAIMDCTFPYFWTINEINKKENNQNINMQIFIKKKLVIKFWKQNSKLIDDINKKYKNDVWNELIKILSKKDIIFEHLISKDKCFLIKKCYIYIDDDKFQKSVWNCSKYYNERKISIDNIIFNDEIIYKNLQLFVNTIKTKYNINNTFKNNKLIIIDRITEKQHKDIFWNKEKLDIIIENIKKIDVIFNGIKILENMSFKEQITLFSENSIFIFRHGSCLINLLWIPNKSLIFDIDDEFNRENRIKRIAQLTNSKSIYIDYNNIDYNKIKNEINNFIK